MFWWPLVFLLTACFNAGARTSHSPAGTGSATANLSGVLTVQDAVRLIATLPSDAAQQPITVVAHINQPPSQESGSIALPANCPVIAARLPTLTDQPFLTAFSVVGTNLPNPIPPGLPSLDLVIPFSLGILDLPARAELHGHLFDPAYTSCPDARNLFVLDSISNPESRATPQPTSNDQLSASWKVWADQQTGLALNYPDGWNVQESRNAGSIVTAEFTQQSPARHISLNVIAGETHWTQQTTDAAPQPLQGQRQLLANAGQALARLVDVVGDQSQQGSQRTLRLVFNYGGNTVILSTRFVDGAALDPQLLGIFTGMASSFRFDKPLSISDPMDPTLTASATIGAGPFISQGDAISVAVASSGLTQVKVQEASMVSEKAAREATPGVCREFQERPQAVWLIKLDGTKPTGEATTRLVYLDAETGESICQTDLAGG